MTAQHYSQEVKDDQAKNSAKQTHKLKTKNIVSQTGRLTDQRRGEKQDSARRLIERRDSFLRLEPAPGASLALDRCELGVGLLRVAEEEGEAAVRFAVIRNKRSHSSTERIRWLLLMLGADTKSLLPALAGER